MAQRSEKAAEGPPARSSPEAESKRRKMLEGRIQTAQEKVAWQCNLSILRGRCCLVGLLVLEMLRGTAWWQGTIPGYPVLGMHFLTTASDCACILCALPFYAAGISGQCVSSGCLGPMLTLVFAMALVDFSALCAFLVIATPRPLAPGARSILDVLEAAIGAWEFALVGSVAFQIALCACSWRVYRDLRQAGLYPPGTDPGAKDKIKTVSCLEVVCDAEDVEYMSECITPRPKEKQAQGAAGAATP
eukprot:CAMPEP_0171271246 /NCGR_PEP_ID=MMETSP0790-20130122/61131_1 /TAXON_ID=2925 /ORGANISM="Alexandrium catenella, Strain OF101" /LENGTH=245 /DNA_ID=CAMNT_0011740119 /DNA_START=14 /DNA_END=748 /DNA_ORIENTATION=-